MRSTCSLVIASKFQLFASYSHWRLVTNCEVTDTCKSKASIISKVQLGARIFDSDEVQDCTVKKIVIKVFIGLGIQNVSGSSS